MWQIVFSNVFAQGRVVHSNIYGFFDSLGHIVSLPAYDSKVLPLLLCGQCYSDDQKQMMVPLDIPYISHQTF